MTTTTKPPLIAADDARGKTREELIELCSEGMLTVKQAVAFSGISKTRLYEFIASKQLLAMTGEGTRWLIPRRELVRFLASRIAANAGAH